MDQLLRFKLKTSRIALICQVYADIDYLFEVPRNCFWPKPKVDSAVLRFNLKTPPISNVQDFEKFTQICFAQKRKKISNNLKKVLTPDEMSSLHKMCNLDLAQRPEEFDLSDYLKLFNWFKLEF